MRLHVIAAALPLVIGAVPAHASTVTTETTGFAYTVGSGILAAGACDAHAEPGAVATRVTCEINGVSTTRAFPGLAAAAEVVTTTTRPVYLCAQALAIYADGSVVQSAKTCDRLAP